MKKGWLQSFTHTTLIEKIINYSSQEECPPSYRENYIHPYSTDEVITVKRYAYRFLMARVQMFGTTLILCQVRISVRVHSRNFSSPPSSKVINWSNTQRLKLKGMHLLHLAGLCQHWNPGQSQNRLFRNGVCRRRSRSQRRFRPCSAMHGSLARLKAFRLIFQKSKNMK